MFEIWLRSVENNQTCQNITYVGFTAYKWPINFRTWSDCDPKTYQFSPRIAPLGIDVQNSLSWLCFPLNHQRSPLLDERSELCSSAGLRVHQSLTTTNHYTNSILWQAKCRRLRVPLSAYKTLPEIRCSVFACVFCERKTTTNVCQTTVVVALMGTLTPCV
jgi:hypothetical protein